MQKTLTALFLAALLLPAHSTAQYRARLISFDDIKPPNAELTVCWGGLGIDRHQRVYFAVSDENDTLPDDTVIFRYDSRSDTRELLGTLRNISQAAGNLGPDESIGKVHVALEEHKGKMYFASHDYHTIKADYSDMYQRRGGHFYSFDLKTDTFADLSITDNHGVSVPYQGIIAMDILRRQDQLAGFTFPYGDILIYDLKKGRTSFYPGVPQYRRNNVAREIWATKKGKVYFAYGGADFWLWELDTKTGAMQRTRHSNVVSDGFLHGRGANRKGDTVYLLTNKGGDLYAFDVKEERLQDLGTLLPADELAQGRQVSFVFGLILSADEKTLYTLPSRFAEDRVPTLYGYDIDSGVKRQLARFPALEGGTITGANIRDDKGRLYFGFHRDGQVSLLQIERD
ncbi:MAG: hypothetical protein GKR89_01230 [Candidatus Latescibacteria bacterium]|nr:hypothetical protein [Candidatus Latescibacterota bacterium]